VVIGYYVISWNTGVALKYFTVVTLTLAGSLVLYEAIKRFNITRFLFGMKNAGMKKNLKANP
jgi:hypothetical protein